MLEHLFGSKTRLSLLKIFFLQPEQKFFVRELTRILEIQINAIRRELETLYKLGLIIEVASDDKDKNKSTNQKKYYQVNKNTLLYHELRDLLIKAQRLDEQDLIEKITNKAGDVSFFYLTGRFVGREDSPSDMLLVGNVKSTMVDKLIEEYEKEVGFVIRYTVMTDKEYQDRMDIMDKFLFSLLEGVGIKIIDKFSF